MQLGFRPRKERILSVNKLVVKAVLFVSVFFLAIFLLDKIDMPAPNKLIKQEISNDKLITVK